MKPKQPIICHECNSKIKKWDEHSWVHNTTGTRYIICSTKCFEKLQIKKINSVKKLKFSTENVNGVYIKTLDDLIIGKLVYGNLEAYVYIQDTDVRLELRHMEQISNKIKELTNKRKNR